MTIYERSIASTGTQYIESAFNERTRIIIQHGEPRSGGGVRLSDDLKAGERTGK